MHFTLLCNVVCVCVCACACVCVHVWVNMCAYRITVAYLVSLNVYNVFPATQSNYFLTTTFVPVLCLNYTEFKLRCEKLLFWQRVFTH